MARRCHPRRDRVTHAGWQGLIVRLGQSGGDKEQMEWLAADVEPLTCPRPALARLPARLHPPPAHPHPSRAEGVDVRAVGAMQPPSGPSGGDAEARRWGLVNASAAAPSLFSRTDGEGLPVPEKEAGDRKVLISVDGAEPRAQH